MQNQFLKIACYFEAGLAAVAFLVGWLFDINPFADLYFSEVALVNGIIATLPLLILYFGMQQLPFRGFKNIQKLLQDSLGQSLLNAHWTDLFVLACLAGFGEEALFRGLMQTGFEEAWGANLGLIVSGLVFALAHAVTPLYALLALFMSLYLGMSLDYGDQRNLLTPMVIHALYDFVAFLAIVSNTRKDIKVTND
ncbi:MAG: lysostaphin resistance A-like protein [Methylomonas sp.]